MAEDWAAIRADVAAALQSIGETSDGPVATLRKAGTTAASKPWLKPIGTPTDTTVNVLQDTRNITNGNGSAVIATERLLMMNADGPVPEVGDQIAVGLAASDVITTTPFEKIVRVRPVAPAGVAVLYELKLED